MSPAWNLPKTGKWEDWDPGGISTAPNHLRTELRLPSVARARRERLKLAMFLAGVAPPPASLGLNYRWQPAAVAVRQAWQLQTNAGHLIPAPAPTSLASGAANPNPNPNYSDSHFLYPQYMCLEGRDLPY